MVHFMANTALHMRELPVPKRKYCRLVVDTFFLCILIFITVSIFNRDQIAAIIPLYRPSPPRTCSLGAPTAFKLSRLPSEDESKLTLQTVSQPLTSECVLVA